jgi:transcriptional antiterminator NusG
MPRNSEQTNASSEGDEVSEVNAAPETPEEHNEAAAAGAIPSTKQWYIVHTYSGFEKKVKESLEGRVAAFGLTDKIGQIIIPTESVVEVRGGKKVISPRMCYPGYVLVEMDMDDYTWHVVRSTPRVTGFVGRDHHGGETQAEIVV